MGRMARVVVPGTPHHVTQRGNRRQATFFGEGDYLAWLTLAAEAFAAARVSVWAYCLMPNHLHVLAAPEGPDGLARAFGATNVRYTRMINGRERWTGYLWQGRFASFPMDEDYLRQCVRYVGLNPVRAGLVARAVDWPWSSVRGHLDGRPDPLLNPEPVRRLLGDEARTFFDMDLAEEGRRKLRKASLDGRPLGAADWIKALEATSGRVLTTPRRGRPPALKGDTHSLASKGV